MKKPKIREIIIALKSFLSFPYTSKFPRVMPKVPKGFRGRPRYDSDKCVGCGACAEVCPARAIDIEDRMTGKGEGLRVLTHHYDICVYCGQCEKACIAEGGIRLTEEFNLANSERTNMTDRVEKKLLFCEVCGSPVACVDHIRWIARKAGPIAYSNPTLFLTRTKEELGSLLASTPRDRRPPSRSDQMNITCPSCRREILFTEQW